MAEIKFITLRLGSKEISLTNCKMVCKIDGTIDNFINLPNS